MQQHNGTSVCPPAVPVIIENAEFGLRSMWEQISDTWEQNHGFPGLFLSDLKRHLITHYDAKNKTTKPRRI